MITIGILAGGNSSRMGQDKALLDFHGKPLIQATLERVRAIAGEVIVIANDTGRYSFLGLPVFPDRIPGCGALGGIYTALLNAKHEFVAVLGCDMPFASFRLLLAEEDLLIQGNDDVVIPRSAEGLEPLHAVYRKPTCLPAVESALQSGERRIVSWFPRVKVRELSLEEVGQIDQNPYLFENINSPQDLAKLVEIMENPDNDVRSRL